MDFRVAALLAFGPPRVEEGGGQTVRGLRVGHHLLLQPVAGHGGKCTHVGGLCAMAWGMRTLQ